MIERNDTGELILIMVISIASAFFGWGIGGVVKETTIQTACKERGYWQTGQTRITCSVEGEKK